MSRTSYRGRPAPHRTQLPVGRPVGRPLGADRSPDLLAGMFRPPQGASQVAGWALLPLRAFLGFTFTFAGLQKLANPGFFNAHNPASIQAQMLGAGRHSPIHFLLVPLSHVAVLLGLLIALGELAVGLGTLLGLLARVAALGGLLISFSLFLAVSFHSNPYYTGSDIVFSFAWVPLLISGAGSGPSLDAYLGALTRKTMGIAPEAAVSARAAGELQRRTFLVQSTTAATVAGLAVVGGGLVAGLGRLLGGGGSPGPASGFSANASAPLSSTPTSSTPTSAPAAAGGATTTTAASSHPPGTKLGPARDVPVGGAVAFTDPASGDPALVIHPQAGTYKAFDAVCPHAGCTVQYQSGEFVCPCHGSQFNGSTGAVEVGPAQSGLKPIAIAEGSDGNLYAR